MCLNAWCEYKPQRICEKCEKCEKQLYVRFAECIVWCGVSIKPLFIFEINSYTREDGGEGLNKK